jgi:hypothetical protein
VVPLRGRIGALQGFGSTPDSISSEFPIFGVEYLPGPKSKPVGRLLRACDCVGTVAVLRLGLMTEIYCTDLFWRMLFGEEVVEGFYGVEFVFFDVEDGVELGDLENILNFSG